MENASYTLTDQVLPVLVIIALAYDCYATATSRATHSQCHRTSSTTYTTTPSPPRPHLPSSPPATHTSAWSHPTIHHGEIAFRDPRRDHTHGRIWRITAKNRPLVKRPDLVGTKTPELLDYLKSPENWTRQNAKRVRKERGAQNVLPRSEENRAELQQPM